MWKFYSRSPRRFVIEVYSMVEGEITRYYVNQKDLSTASWKVFDKSLARSMDFEIKSSNVSLVDIVIVPTALLLESTITAVEFPSKPNSSNVVDPVTVVEDVASAYKVFEPVIW